MKPTKIDLLLLVHLLDSRFEVYAHWVVHLDLCEQIELTLRETFPNEPQKTPARPEGGVFFYTETNSKC